MAHPWVVNGNTIIMVSAFKTPRQKCGRQVLVVEDLTGIIHNVAIWYGHFFSQTMGEKIVQQLKAAATPFNFINYADILGG